ncbi:MULTISPECIES: AbrB/MazE/SpoVT family DNA-binding domain-containing protein [Neomoorella]|uniref:SpoVT / AbrB like domain protein n=1 Tax=Moorella mulderi DSM 14980 TaxID=1122241 RepID=A0A151AYI0_9FIRM|nr:MULTISPECIES: AbrB/MazE/SpoVT family DNA-binding domain-containing protein [Moorella]KYH32714.1 SpoVT / AbrB like domain protein [Moorella mulderi DSM 14980]MDN5362333.1 hypothetical protein [Moorella sp. (in: firmicutes)]BCV20758.1 hypothetical protein hamaS1_08270 [Moorella sp. Hama-1]
MEVKVSSKYQIVIPKDVRKRLNITKGQGLEIIIKGNTISLVPEKPLSELKGFLKGMKLDDIRDEEDRY